MQQLRHGLWSWTARHPEWTIEQGGPDGWGPDVRSYAFDGGGTLVLFDPLASRTTLGELSVLAADRDVVVYLTYNGHERSSAEIARTFGATVYAPEISRAPLSVASTPYRVGDSLPGGVVVTTGFYPNEATFWVERPRALVAGDVLLGGGEHGVRTPPDSWLAPGVSSNDVRLGLRPLLELSIELLLLTHGRPITRDAHGRLERALAGTSAS